MSWVLSSVGGVAVFAFMFRRRRFQDGRLPGRASTLSSAGAAIGTYDSATFSGQADSAATALDAVPVDAEADIPRWRRPSVQAARRSRFATPTVDSPIYFSAPPPAGVERLVAAYRLVRVGDGPDDLDSQELGRLERGDEVDALETSGEWTRIRRADDLEGWVPSFTLVSRIPPAGDATQDRTGI